MSQFQFSDILKRYIHRSGYSLGQLHRLTGIPKRTLANWAEGRVRQPRGYADLLKLAAALHLSAVEASSLLEAAHHPPLAELRLQINAPEILKLLAPWHHPVQQSASPAPFQVIPDLPFFVGRENELEILGKVLRDDRAVPVCILGMGGLGKTVLAARAAYLLRRHFSDGVLWARVDAADPMSILQSFANAYQCDISHYADLDSRSRMVRDIMAYRRTLIILDSAQSSQQIEPFLPPTGTSRVIITSRFYNLAVTTGMRRLHLRPFSPEKQEALTLFSKIIGAKRASQDQEALIKIADMLGHLPLAVSIAASRLAYEPGWSTAALLAKLHQEENRLAELSYRLIPSGIVCR